MKVFFIIIFLRLFIVLDLAVAQTQPANNEIKPPLAKLLQSETMSKLLFNDGREAHLVGQIKESIPIKVQFQIIENSCFPELSMPQCQWSIDAYRFKIAWIWTKNPDSAKINKTLFVKSTQYSSSQETILEDADINITAEMFIPSNREDLKKSYVLKCDNYEWLQKFAKLEDGNGYILPSWTAEQMLNNTLTKKDENTSIAQLEDSVLKPMIDSQFKLIINKKVEGDLFSNIIPVLDTQTIYYTHSNKACSLQIKTNVNLGNVSDQLDAQKYLETIYIRIPPNINQNTFFKNSINKLGLLIKQLKSESIVEVQ